MKSDVSPDSKAPKKIMLYLTILLHCMGARGGIGGWDTKLQI
jgi:hypothetical protein